MLPLIDNAVELEVESLAARLLSGVDPLKPDMGKDQIAGTTAQVDR